MNFILSTFFTMTAVTFSPDVPYIDKFNGEDLPCLSGLTDSRSCYINVNEDFNCLSSAAGGYITRYLISISENEILPKSEAVIETQTFYPGDVLYAYHCNSSMSNRICKLDKEYWVPEEKQIIIKEDSLSTKYAGRIKVIVYNTTEDKCIIKKNTTIASLITSLHSYMDPTPGQYRLFHPDI